MTSPQEARPRRRPLVIAHRGASDVAAEHTLEAYTAAIGHGVDGVECDVRLTADRHLVCVHDRKANRTSNGTGVISTLELAELEQLDWGSWKQRDHGSDTDSPDADPERGRLLTLRRLLQVLVEQDRDLVTLVETKHPTRYFGQVEHELVALLDELGLGGGAQPGMPDVRVMSFSRLALKRMHRLAPEVPLVHLREVGAPSVHQERGLPKGARAVGFDIRFLRLNPRVVARQHRQGHEVYVFTVNRPKDVQRCIDLGVDVLITDRLRHVIDLVAAND